MQHIMQVAKLLNIKWTMTCVRTGLMHAHMHVVCLEAVPAVVPEISSLMLLGVRSRRIAGPLPHTHTNRHRHVVTHVDELI